MSLGGNMLLKTAIKKYGLSKKKITEIKRLGHKGVRRVCFYVPEPQFDSDYPLTKNSFFPEPSDILKYKRVSINML